MGEAPIRGFLCVGKAPDYYLTYFGIKQPAKLVFNLPEDGRYRVESIDTWEMKVEVCASGLSGRSEIAFAGKPFMAIRVRKTG